MESDEAPARSALGTAIGQSASAALTAAPARAAGPATSTPGATAITPGATGVVGGLTPQLIAAVGARKLIIDDLDSLLLFEDERRQAQQILADWATASGLSIVPPAQSERGFALAAEGKHALTGAACGPVLDRELARERWLPALGGSGRIMADVYCETDCVLQVSIELTGLGTEFYSAPFDPAQPWRQELARRLPTVVDNGGHDQHGHLNNPVPIAGVKPGPGGAGVTDLLVGDGNALALTKKQDAAIAQACGVKAAPAHVLLAPTPSGAPRCEAMADMRSYHEADRKVNACVCAALSKDAKLDRRRHATIEGAASDGVEAVETKDGLRVAAEAVASPEVVGRYMKWFFPGSGSLSHCFAARTAVQETEKLNVTIDFDREGNAVKVVIGDLNGLLKKEERDCVQKQLRTARAPCPEEASSSGIGYLWLSVRKP